MTGAAESIGDIATGGLIAREIEAAHAGKPALGHDVHEPCANCGTVRCGPYCHACGQAGHVHRSIGALAHDIAHGVFHFEGKLWATLPLLIRRPGELTRRYVRGERAKFVSPMALFLFSVFLMFAVVSHSGGGHEAAPPIVKDKAYFTRLIGETQAKIQRDQVRLAGAAAEDRADIAQTLAERRERLTRLQAQLKVAPGKVMTGKEAQAEMLETVKAESGWHWLDEAINHAAANPKLLLYKMKSNGYKYSWALIPISLPFIWLLFAFRRDTGFYDHAIFATYSLSFMSLGVVALTLLSLAGLPGTLVAVAALIVPPWHMYRQLKGAYALGRFGALWRTATLLLITCISLSLFLTLLFYLGSD